MKKITIADVAKRAGVSKSTVSFVINAKKNVRPETRDHVLNVMKELHYRPKGIARNLKNKVTAKSIGIIIKDLQYPFYYSIAQGAKDFASSKGYTLFIVSSEDEQAEEQKLSNLFSLLGIQGAIIAPIIEKDSEIEHLFNLKMLNYPFVLLGDVKGIQANVVAIDNNKAIRKVVKYLIDSGHKKIIHFAGSSNASHTQERIDAFKEAFSERELIFDKNMVIPIGSFYDESYSNTLKYFEKKQKKDLPSAIICFNDIQALAVIAVLGKLNIKVPEEVTVIGNDDIAFADIYKISLSTVRAPKYEIGKRAAEILIKNIESRVYSPIERVLLDGELVIRESSRVLNARS